MKYIKNINLVTKLILSYFFLITIPFLISTFILSHTSTANIKDNTLTYIDMFVEQITSNIDSYVSELDRMTKVATLDNTLCGILTSTEPYNALDSYNADQYLTNYMLNLMTQQPNIQTVTFIGKNNKVFTGTSNYISDLDKFYEITKLNQISEKNHKLYISNAHIPSYLIINPKVPVFCVVRQLYTLDNDYIGSIILNIICENLIDIININPKLLEGDGRVIITNSQNEIIADTSDKFNTDTLLQNEILTFNAENNKASEHLYFSSSSDFSSLTATVIINKESLFKSTYTFNRLALIMIVIIMIIIILLSVYFAFYLVRPIQELKNATEEFSQGNYDIKLTAYSNDEVGKLCGSFNAMVLKIKTLLEDVYVYQLQNKQAQLEALQNQINPHFLHNTLETIRMKALINSDKEVANMIKILAKLFRITLDRTQNVVTLKDELEHVETYVSIQNMRFNNRFNLQINIPPELKNCSIIKLSLQPIVENCIVHGFSNTYENETIAINASYDDTDIIISISDNGKGFDADNLERMLKKLDKREIMLSSKEEHNSIGIVNISERITLEYGPDYYLTISPNIPHGTTVILKIPKNDFIPLAPIE